MLQVPKEEQVLHRLQTSDEERPVLDDPCAGQTGDNRYNCIIGILATDYNVSVDTAFQTAYLNGDVDSDPLEVIYQTVRSVGDFIAPYTDGLSAAEAFAAVFGPVEFRYTTEGIYGLTYIAPGDDQGLGEITLPAALFNSDEFAFPITAQYIITHELGHILENRLGRTTQPERLQVIENGVVVYEVLVGGNTPRVIADYLHATGAQTGDTTYYDIYDTATYNAIFNFRQLLVILEGEIYLLEDFFLNELVPEGEENIEDKAVSPMEGFAESFAFYVLYSDEAIQNNPDLLLEPRIPFMRDNMQVWIDTLNTR